MHLQDFLDLVLPSEAPMAAMAAKATEKSQSSVNEMTTRARNKAQEQYSKPPANGLTVPPPPQQRGLQMLDPQRIRPPMAVVNWQMPPAWPSEALEGQPIKLPRQTKVQQVCHIHCHTALSPCLCLSSTGAMPGWHEGLKFVTVGTPLYPTGGCENHSWPHTQLFLVWPCLLRRRL
jgi:hypothetical protein